MTINTEQFDVLDAKLNAILHALEARPDPQRYLSAKDVGRMVGLDPRTILNRSNLPPGDPRFIPSLRLGTKRKYFERKTIDRLFRLNGGPTVDGRPTVR